MSGEKVGLISLEEAPKRAHCLAWSASTSTRTCWWTEAKPATKRCWTGSTTCSRTGPASSTTASAQTRPNSSASASSTWPVRSTLTGSFSTTSRCSPPTWSMNGVNSTNASPHSESVRGQLDIGMIMVSHLTRPGGRGHEDGAAVGLSQLRSSHSLAQLADAAIGLQKDPEDPDSDRPVCAGLEEPLFRSNRRRSERSSMTETLAGYRNLNWPS